jgi:FMN-dependent NADH-azoreductase
VPIYNFGVPASLKAWIDMIARAGVTFQIHRDRPAAAAGGQARHLRVASGGTPVDGPIDFATGWLRHVMGFVGITDVQVVRSDRQMVDAEASRARAAEDIEALAA